MSPSFSTRQAIQYYDCVAEVDSAVQLNYSLKNATFILVLCHKEILN